jgi:hypothetical protein
VGVRQLRALHEQDGDSGAIERVDDAPQLHFAHQIGCKLPVRTIAKRLVKLGGKPARFRGSIRQERHDAVAIGGVANDMRIGPRPDARMEILAAKHRGEEVRNL